MTIRPAFALLLALSIGACADRPATTSSSIQHSATLTEEIRIGASYLAGAPRQPRLDVGWATVRAADAPPAALALRVVATEKQAEGDQKPRVKNAAFSLKDDNYRGPYVLDEIEEIWLTLPPLKEEKKEEKKLRQE